MDQVVADVLRREPAKLDLVVAWIERFLADPDFSVHSKDALTEWLDLINRREILCSILWPEPPLFSLQGPNYHGRHHDHEKRYRNIYQRNLSYREGCRRLAEKLNQLVSGKKCLVYAPLRGALPIWKGIRQFMPGSDCETYYAVTSSFVIYPEPFRIFNKKGRPASGRHTNILELRSRIKPILANFDFLIYTGSENSISLSIFPDKPDALEGH